MKSSTFNSILSWLTLVSPFWVSVTNGTSILLHAGNGSVISDRIAMALSVTEQQQQQQQQGSSSSFEVYPILDVASQSGGFFLDEFEAVTRSDTLECPSANVITTRYKCQVKDQWVDCYRRHCCQGYNFVAGRCLPETVDPCSQDFCEQKCSVYFGRVICTCFSGYRFSPEHHKRGIKPVCLDIDECAIENGNCQHICNNEPGTFRCECREGYRLRGDNSTCELVSEGGMAASPDQWRTPEEAVSLQTERHSAGNTIGPYELRESRGRRCSASCSSVGNLENKIKSLEERIVALSTAVRLYSFSAGPPGPEGPPGPPGAAGPRGFPGPAGGRGTQGPKGERGPEWTPPASWPPLDRSSSVQSDDPLTHEDYPLDSWTVLQSRGKGEFCRCRRGPVGPPGAPGKSGPRGFTGPAGSQGEKGEPGSFDFLLLMMADVKHDIQMLQNKVFSKDDRPEPYDLEGMLEAESKSSRKDQYETQLQEILTEEVDNQIYGAATLFQQNQSKDLLEPDTVDDNRSPVIPPPMPSLAPKPQIHQHDKSETNSFLDQEHYFTELETTSSAEEYSYDTTDGYYDTLDNMSDLSFTDVPDYEYGSLSDVAYIAEYAAVDSPSSTSRPSPSYSRESHEYVGLGIERPNMNTNQDFYIRNEDQRIVDNIRTSDQRPISRDDANWRLGYGVFGDDERSRGNSDGADNNPSTLHRNQYERRRLSDGSESGVNMERPMESIYTEEGDAKKADKLVDILDDIMREIEATVDFSQDRDARSSQNQTIILAVNDEDPRTITTSKATDIDEDIDVNSEIAHQAHSISETTSHKSRDGVGDEGDEEFNNDELDKSDHVEESESGGLLDLNWKSWWD